MENNQEQIKLCPTCGAKNKAIYQYCNECGEPLNQPANIPNPAAQNSYNPQPNDSTQPNYNAQPNYSAQTQNPNYGTNAGGYYANPNQQTYTPPYQTQNSPYFNHVTAEVESTPDFDGISATDVYDFTGRKIELFRKLKKQHFEHGSGPYCWPLLILGLVLGFFGMGCWYLYHKLYKPAIGFFVAAVASLGANIALCWVMFKQILDFLPDYIGDIISGNQSGAVESMTSAILEKILPLSIASSALSTIVFLATLVLSIVLPFTAYKLYKNNALRKIYKTKMNPTAQHITSVGGSRGGLVAVVSVIWGVVSIASLVVLIAWMLSSVFTMANDYFEEYGYPDTYSYETPYEEDYDFSETPFDFGDFGDFGY